MSHLQHGDGKDPEQRGRLEQPEVRLVVLALWSAAGTYDDGKTGGGKTGGGKTGDDKAGDDKAGDLAL